MNDNVKRGLRTLFQSFLGLVASGGLAKIWEDYFNHHDVDSTTVIAVGLVITAIVTWAQNEIEDQTGKGVAVPVDRALGDQQLGSGVGSK